jgi:RNA polymerase sigma-70 factor (ECF subfamily)
MRRILVDAARARESLKRGGEHTRVALDPELTIVGAPSVDLIALDDALNALAVADQRRSRVVELRFFGGLSVEETGEVLDVSLETVMRDWKVAKAWLLKKLNPPSQVRRPPAPG